MKLFIATCLLSAATVLSSSAYAQGPAAVSDPAAIDACRATGLAALQEHSPSVKDLILDVDGLTVATADTNIEGIPVRMVIMGEAYLERKETGKPQRFLCLIGEKGKVLLTFFTVQ
jgi:hypothetical protein